LRFSGWGKSKNDRERASQRSIMTSVKSCIVLIDSITGLS